MVRCGAHGRVCVCSGVWRARLQQAVCGTQTAAELACRYRTLQELPAVGRKTRYWSNQHVCACARDCVSVNGRRCVVAAVQPGMGILGFNKTTRSALNSCNRSSLCAAGSALYRGVERGGSRSSSHLPLCQLLPALPPPPLPLLPSPHVAASMASTVSLWPTRLVVQDRLPRANSLRTASHAGVSACARVSVGICVCSWACACACGDEQGDGGAGGKQGACALAAWERACDEPGG